jgi:hypothetical protein
MSNYYDMAKYSRLVCAYELVLSRCLAWQFSVRFGGASGKMADHLNHLSQNIFWSAERNYECFKIKRKYYNELYSLTDRIYTLGLDQLTTAPTVLNLTISHSTIYSRFIDQIALA